MCQYASVHVERCSSRSRRSHSICGERRPAEIELVQRHDVPRPQRVAVVAAAVAAGVLAEVVEVRRGVGGEVVVVAWSRACARLVTAPARLVTVVKLVGSRRRVRVIADGEHRARNRIEQTGRCGRAGAVGDLAVRNVARAHEHGRLTIRRGLNANRRVLRVPG
jgi:hypothetical protein